MSVNNRRLSDIVLILIIGATTLQHLLTIIIVLNSTPTTGSLLTLIAIQSLFPILIYITAIVFFSYDPSPSPSLLYSSVYSLLLRFITFWVVFHAFGLGMAILIVVVPEGVINLINLGILSRQIPTEQRSDDYRVIRSLLLSNILRDLQGFAIVGAGYFLLLWNIMDASIYEARFQLLFVISITAELLFRYVFQHPLSQIANRLTISTQIPNLPWQFLVTYYLVAFWLKTLTTSDSDVTEISG